MAGLRVRPPFSRFREAGENANGDTLYRVLIDWQDGRGPIWEFATVAEELAIRARLSLGVAWEREGQ